MKILVLLGDNSPEREVSLRSGRAVADALRAGGHEVTQYDPANGYNGLKQFVGKVDCVFPILHGVGGEDGTIQEELEKLKFKYLGSDSKVSQLCFNKTEFKKILDKSSILTPKWEVVTKDTVKQSRFLAQPYVLKPIEGGSTIDMQIVRKPKNNHYDEQIFDKYEQMLMEELIEGDEITVSILGDAALPVIEIIPPEGQEFDYKNKYNGKSQELCPPKNISVDKQVEAQRLTERIHDKAGARHLSRTDIIITPASEVYVLEINTIPGMSSQSLYPKAAQQAGLDMVGLVQKFVEMTVSTWTCYL